MQDSNQKPPNKSPNSYLRYMGLAGQMIAIILMGYGLGYFIEKQLKPTNHLILGITTLVFVCLSMYVAIRDITSYDK